MEIEQGSIKVHQGSIKIEQGSIKVHQGSIKMIKIYLFLVLDAFDAFVPRLAVFQSVVLKKTFSESSEKNF